MNKQTTLLAGLVILISLSANTATAQENFVVIVNKDVVETNLSANTIRRIYFGLNTNWMGSQTIKPSYTDVTGEEFWRLLSTNQSSYNEFWSKREKLGNGSAPVAMKNGTSIIDYVSSTEGAIGIIDRELADEIGEDCRVVIIGD